MRHHWPGQHRQPCRVHHHRARGDAHQPTRSKIVHRALPENDPKQRQPDISLAEELLGWKPRVALKEGLIRTIKYFELLLSDEALRAQLAKEAMVEPG